MSKLLTARQHQVLNTLQDYLDKNGYAPSIRELRQLLGISSLRGVTIHLDALEKKGWIHRESTSRSIRILIPRHQKPQSTRSIPLLGTITAGLPILAVENIERNLQVPEEFSSPDDNLFALRVRGDSMTGDLIGDGDILIVHAQSSADNGDIVAALIGDEATVKRLDTKSQPPKLLPSNPDYDPIELKQYDCKILGKVIGLIRSYKTF